MTDIVRNIAVSLVVAATVAVLIVLGFNSHEQKPFGNAGADQYAYQSFYGGVLVGNTYATSTPTSLTIKTNDVAYYDTVIVTPTGAAADKTITFPASTTASYWLPKPGNTQRTCFFNSTTTANVNLVFAGGTGFDLEVASSSATALGASTIAPGKWGCFTFVRGPQVATKYDISALYQAFK
jgi:hypothetical protein